MAERLHQSGGRNFDSYPSEPLLPGEINGKDGKSGLEEKARGVGRALGRTVVTLREATQAVKDIGNETREVAAIRVGDVTNKAREAGVRVTETVRQKTTEWGEAAAGTAEELRRSAMEKARDLSGQVRTGYYRARLRANQTVREYPLHVVVGAGAVGFLLGAGLRIWRWNREY
jgi:ElaB/YqjD/DUF883 family membrane-anchored ribosome-binding protein